jgi:23S rRNA (adenine2030-N6)-methyltransferase
MNYRHIYHAGNVADVLKHAVLARLVTYLRQKDKAFRVLDTHAGIGLYDLSTTQAQKTGEWRDGIGKLLEAALPPSMADLLEPYLSMIRTLNPEGGLRFYPGSPLLVRQLLRPQDRLSAMELHPEDCDTLRHLFEGDHQVRVTLLDGWLALGAHLPPKERRGLILVDPPFEIEGEYERLVEGLHKGWRRFAGGMFCLWYPLKAGAPVAAFHAALQALDIPNMLAVELVFRDATTTMGLSGSGLILVNPPYTLHKELESLLPWLRDTLAMDASAASRLWWLRGE